MLGKSKIENFRIQKELFADDKSRLRKYQDIVVGKRGWFSLIRYELIMLFSSWLPGALGLFLRGKLYPLLLDRTGKGVLFGANVVLRHPHKIHLGDNVVVDDNCVLDAKGTDNKGIVIGNDVFLGRNTILFCKDGDIQIGDNTVIGCNCEIFSANVVQVGKNVQIAAYSYLNGGTHDFDRTDIPVMEQDRSGKGIIIEDNVWLAANVKVLDGLIIGKDSVVSAGAVVYKDLPPFSISGGVPARVTRMRSGESSTY